MSTDRPNPTVRSRKLRYHHRVQAETQPRAINHWQRWTAGELAIALDRKRTARDIALQLGRTAKGVEKVRRQLEATPPKC